MNVGSVQQSAYNAYLSKEAADKPSQQAEGTQQQPDVVVDLGAKDASAAYTRPKGTKGLSADEIKALKTSQLNNQTNFLKSMMQGNMTKQANQSFGITQFNFDGVLINTSEFELPAGGSTPEEAAKAIAEGGAYSINAVSDRIFSLAEKLANGDAGKLETLKKAVQKGFDQAGLDFKAGTQSNLPQISHDTYQEIMDRFAKLEEKLKQSEPDQNAQAAPLEK